MTEIRCIVCGSLHVGGTFPRNPEPGYSFGSCRREKCGWGNPFKSSAVLYSMPVGCLFIVEESDG